MRLSGLPVLTLDTWFGMRTACNLRKDRDRAEQVAAEPVSGVKHPLHDKHLIPETAAPVGKRRIPAPEGDAGKEA